MKFLALITLLASLNAFASETPALKLEITNKETGKRASCLLGRFFMAKKDVFLQGEIKRCTINNKAAEVLLIARLAQPTASGEPTIVVSDLNSTNVVKIEGLTTVDLSETIQLKLLRNGITELK